MEMGQGYIIIPVTMRSYTSIGSERNNDDGRQIVSLPRIPVESTLTRQSGRCFAVPDVRQHFNRYPDGHSIRRQPASDPPAIKNRCDTFVLNKSPVCVDDSPCA